MMHPFFVSPLRGDLFNIARSTNISWLRHDGVATRLIKTIL
jgi:hypothetical protein